MKYIYIIVGLLILALIFGVGYTAGIANVKIVHDTTTVVDTIVKVDSFYQYAKPDTIIINNVKFDAKFSSYVMHRSGYASVWYIPAKESFKWQVREPDPIVITNTKYEQIRVPTLDWKSVLTVGTVSLIAGFIGGAIWK